MIAKQRGKPLKNREKKYLMKESDLGINIKPYKELSNKTGFAFKIIAIYELSIRNSKNQKLITDIINEYKSNELKINYFFQQYQIDQNYFDNNPMDFKYEQGEKSYRNIFNGITQKLLLFPLQEYNPQLKSIYSRAHIFDDTILDIISCIFAFDKTENVYSDIINYENLLYAIQKKLAVPDAAFKNGNTIINVYQIYDKIYIESIKNKNKMIYTEIIECTDSQWDPEDINDIWAKSIVSYEQVVHFLNYDISTHIVFSNLDFENSLLPFLMGAQYEEMTMNKNVLFFNSENTAFTGDLIDSFDFFGFGLLDEARIIDVKNDEAFKHIKNVLKKKDAFIQDLFVFDFINDLSKRTTNVEKIRKVKEIYNELQPKIKSLLDIKPPNPSTLYKRQLFFVDGIEKGYFRYF